MKRHIVIPVFVPHMGCPFDCIYCNQKKISGQTEKMTPMLMKNIIEAHLETISADNTYIEIGFYGGSFTGIPEEEQIMFLETANEYLREGLVHGIRLSTRPDYINAHILDYLSCYNVGTIELGVQSMDNDVLRESCRGHDTKAVYDAACLIHKFNFTLGIQTMIGLPGDTKEKAIESARAVVALRPSIVRIYPTLVLKDTYLERLYLNGKYIPLNLDEAVEISALLLRIYREHNINVIRIGLQPSENINTDADVIAGPCHPAFRQLVESKLFLDELVEHFAKNEIRNYNTVEILVNPKNISDLVGQHKANIHFLQDKFNIRHIKVKPFNGISRFVIKIPD